MATRIRISGRRRFAVALVLVVVGLAAGLLAAPDSAAAKSARYSRFDVDVTVQDDGSWHVVETQTVDFQGGPFATGHRDIPVARTDGITNISVAELRNGEAVPFTAAELDTLSDGVDRYAVLQLPASVDIYWSFPFTTDETRTFVVQYDMLGALRSYPTESPPNQQVWWTAVGSELTSETPVDAARVRITLPKAVDVSSVVAQPLNGPTAQSLTNDGKTFTWEHGPFASGDDLTVRLQFPVILPNVAPPDWQVADDAQRARQEQQKSRDAVVHLFMLAIGLLAIGGGSSGLYGLWYLRGRDPHVGLVAQFLPQPPDDLSPGAAGALVDEVANECDVIATLLDLVRRGAIGMAEASKNANLARPYASDYVFELASVEGPFAAHERRMLETMFGRDPKVGAVAALSTFAPRVRANYEAFKQDLYGELVRKGYFVESPESTRQRWKKVSWVVMIGSLGVLIVGLLAFDAFAIIPAVAVFVIGLALRRIGKAMPRKTDAGAEAAAKWNAFKRYLSDIEKYENVDESRRIFEKFLPYTVAFGVDTGWVAAFARANPRPSILSGVGDVVAAPYGSGDWGTWGRPHHGGTYVGTGGGGGIDLPDLDMPNIPSLQKMSNKAGSGVQSGSSGLMDVLKVAGAILEIASAFTGGGGSGGSSGGGGGGFK